MEIDSLRILNNAYFLSCRWRMRKDGEAGLKKTFYAQPDNWGANNFIFGQFYEMKYIGSSIRIFIVQ